MKFLPQQYRESQGEWCAKKRFSWHITVAIRKNESEMHGDASLCARSWAMQSGQSLSCNAQGPCFGHPEERKSRYQSCLLSSRQRRVLRCCIHYSSVQKKSVRELASAFNVWISREEKNRAIYLLQPWKTMYVPLSKRAMTSLQLHNCTLQRHIVKFLELECPWYKARSLTS